MSSVLEALRKRVDSIKLLALALGRTQPDAAVLELLVESMIENHPHVRRVCVWLGREWAFEEAKLADAALNDEHAGLFLAASAAREGMATTPPWALQGGDFSRLPLDEPLIGQVAASRRPTIAHEEKEWPQYPDWARREGIVAYMAAPMLHAEQVLGVLAIFLDTVVTRDVDREAAFWLELLADQAAGALAISRAFEEIRRLKTQLEHDGEYLREEINLTSSFGGFVGESPALRRVLERIELVAPTDASVLLLGESGTGKELVAREIHERSRRRERPLIKVNCASIPRDLFESEFFGHVKGSFTGAIRDRVGRFRLAHHGTLFLDEVGEIPPELQGKLLRVLQEGEFEPIGDERTQKVDVRVIAATNRNLAREIRARRFREDLYFRLSVFPLEVPPLRARQEDIPLLAAHFLRLSCRRHGLPEARLKKRHVLELQAYPWPGNVRELQNAIERAVLYSRRGPLRFELPASPVVSKTGAAARPAAAAAGRQLLTYRDLKRLEREAVRAALATADGKVSGPRGAAALLGLKPSTLSSRMKALRIDRS